MPTRAGGPPLVRRKGSPYWQTWIYQDGKRIRLSTQCTDRKAAADRACQLQREGARESGPGDGATVEDALLAFVSEPGSRAASTVGAYDRRAEKIVEAIGNVRLDKLSAEHINHYINTRKGSKATKRCELTVLWMALKLARKRGWPAPPREMIEVAIPGATVLKERWLSDAEIEALCDELHGYHAAWVRVACWTGARREEVNGLRWEDVDLTTGSIRIRGTKTYGSDRTIPMPAPMVAWALLRRHTGPLVRHWINPTPGLHSACKRAGIEQCSAHDFRRTFASRLKQRGIDSLLVARLMGKKSAASVDLHYARLDLGSLRGAIEVGWPSESAFN